MSCPNGTLELLLGIREEARQLFPEQGHNMEALCDVVTPIAVHRHPALFGWEVSSDVENRNHFWVVAKEFGLWMDVTALQFEAFKDLEVIVGPPALFKRLGIHATEDKDFRKRAERALEAGWEEVRYRLRHRPTYAGCSSGLWERVESIRREALALVPGQGVEALSDLVTSVAVHEYPDQFGWAATMDFHGKKHMWLVDKVYGLWWDVTLSQFEHIVDLHTVVGSPGVFRRLGLTADSTPALRDNVRRVLDGSWGEYRYLVAPRTLREETGALLQPRNHLVAGDRHDPPHRMQTRHQ